MKKPHEEAWSISDDQRGTVVIYGEDGLYEPILFAEGNEVRSHGPERHAGYDRDHARAKLAAAAPEMARRLLEYYGWTDRACPSLTCNGPLDDGTHGEECEIETVLRKAGVLEPGDT